MTALLEADWRDAVRAVDIAYDVLPQRVVLAHGCFDLLHLGHIRHLREARSLGDQLVVSVTADPHVGKGVGRPHFTAEQRAEALRALDCVDKVVITDEPNAVDVIKRLRPAVYVKGPDYNGSDDPVLAREASAALACGGRIHFTAGERWSSSRLINMERFPDGVQDYLQAARQHEFLPRILEAFERADSLNIAFVGETIIDEYRYVEALGKASKEFALATVETGKESFIGGVVAASKQAEWKKVTLVTPSTSIKKTRFVDRDFNRKIFEVYDRRTIEVHPLIHAEWECRLAGEVNAADVVVVFDFGHGLITPQQRSVIERNAEFLAVNAQTNAGNYGFNPITRWARADFVCLDEPEARLATRMREQTLREVAAAIRNGFDDVPEVLVTRGRYGSYCFGDDDGECPPFVTNGIDTMGAGDAVMAVVAPLLAAGLDLEAAAFVGNVVGAIKVSIVGHRRHVERKEILQTVEALLK